MAGVGTRVDCHSYKANASLKFAAFAMETSEGLALPPDQRLHRRWRGVVAVVADTGAGDEMEPVDQLRLGFHVFDDLLHLFQETLRRWMGLSSGLYIPLGRRLG